MTAEEIKRTVSMPEILNRYGIRYRGRNISCPFHGKDTNPSMQIFKDGYKCHACGAAGDIFSFVENMEGVGFKDAFKILGGTYQYESKQDRRRKISKIQRERKEYADKKLRRTLARTIKALRIAVDICDPMGDMWSFAQHELPTMLYIWEEKYINGNEVNDIDVYRKCGVIDERLGVG